MNGREYKLKLFLTIKSLSDCPLQGKLYVKLKLGHSNLWKIFEAATLSVPCVDRTVEWDAKFEIPECSVFVGNLEELQGAGGKKAHKQLGPEQRKLLLSKQPSAGHLRLSVRQESEKVYKQHKRYGFLNIDLIDWALAYGDSASHDQGLLVNGTKKVSTLAVNIRIEWLGEQPACVGKRSDNTLSTEQSFFADAKEDRSMKEHIAGQMAQSFTMDTLHEDDAELTVDQIVFLGSEKTGGIKDVSHDIVEDQVLSAIEASKMSAEQEGEVVQEVMRRVMELEGEVASGDLDRALALCFNDVSPSHQIAPGIGEAILES
mmetsp:Transcript_44157/g.69043  ORF Transcript_44157/g.69043 Transcript_44157/m.69043 type:complete len:317 (+) Transcript_44157:97-1047(+)|eukprot:CAMPEP_0184291918 /NCGR_PEP_ID=MMETSP1049-20130417/3789_1 /TAXON_ID=77928 /ORGANISM="Proteomonas sulcata, Strain CCMP704" /LENGTH=316 /DNA_ID=CAMNT_0026599495 /DNA_START=81 /DNA_END=1031 /DNA_ORIENTATION=-